MSGEKGRPSTGPPLPAATGFRCEVAELDDEVLVAVTGNLDADAEEEFRRFLTDATAPGKPVFIDLTAVTFIGGRGYRAVRRAARALPPGPGPVL